MSFLASEVACKSPAPSSTLGSYQVPKLIEFRDPLRETVGGRYSAERFEQKSPVESSSRPGGKSLQVRAVRP